MYESRLPPKKPVLSSALNLFTGTLLLLLIMAGVLWWIARTITWRINQMSQQMAQLVMVIFTVRVNARGNDEIASLARGFNQAAQKIEHLIDANNLLLAHASHELRTPITRIRLQIEMMDMLAGALPSDTKAKFDKRAQAINRDLSGLNDLVESILLVSRLDAGHALQQVESLDLYDLVNQERQHYPEATLIGEHIVIDGQSSMLTHLIRNLLTNAMLHGKPPVTVLLYGVQTIDEADTIPDYLLQTILYSSFADYNSSDFDSYHQPIEVNEDDTHNHIAHSHTHSNDSSHITGKVKPEATDAIILLPAPPIYRNGENIAVEHDLNSDADADADVNIETKIDKADINNINGDIDSIETCATLTESTDANSVQTDSSTSTNSVNSNDTVGSTSASSLIANYHNFTNDLTDKIKKMVWKAVPDTEESSAVINDAKSTALNDTVPKSKGAVINKGGTTRDKGDAQNNTQNPTEVLSTPRKEGLFAKHLKKAKTDPVRPLPKYAVLAVIDEGTGIPEDKREEVFSPFVRLQQKNKGSGLGLSLVSQIVTAHQGRIITDTLNGHTRFLVVIPVKRPTLSPA
ncbi:sensor histidine kinase [Psychrobacter sp. WY6]|uniref:HAMP domain-containing sensor histidine kinase n=1 Tax=Psychrobacter sp. WY6 TaxID=2708350 RepID=UPI002022F205|nr:sensor histidine kinase [Psychrobacter sp. WY6]